MRMSQVILHKHYEKMKREQIVAISIGKTVPKNAPIKYAELVEGMSDVDLDEEGNSLPGDGSDLGSGEEDEQLIRPEEILL